MTCRVVTAALAALAVLSVLLAPPTQAQPGALAVALTEYLLSPAQIQVTLGEEVQIRIFNNGTRGHTFVIEGYANYDTNITPGSQANVFFTADALGTYPMYCSNHRTLGMVGTFTIRSEVVVPPLPVVEVVGLLVASTLAAVAVVVLLRSRRDSDT